MRDADLSQTSPTLLRRVSDASLDQTAWDEFVDRYAPKIYRWCNASGLQPADAEDVTQNVLVDLARQMRSFQYNPTGSFRAWLRTVAYRARCDFVARNDRPGRGSGDTQVLRQLDAVEAREAVLDRLAAEFDRELFDLAAERVRKRVEARTWESFRLTAIEGLSGAEAAAKLGMAVLAVFKSKSRVQKMLQEEIERFQATQPLPYGK